MLDPRRREGPFMKRRVVCQRDVESAPKQTRPCRCDRKVSRRLFVATCLLVSGPRCQQDTAKC